jgi:hypothetical protein
MDTQGSVWRVIPDFTIVNYLFQINTLGFGKNSPFPLYLIPYLPEDIRIAAKSDTKSGYNILPGPYCVFTTVNRNKAMNTIHTMISGLKGVPDGSGNPARAYPVLQPGNPLERFSGIRSAGQYCCCLVLTGTSQLMTAVRNNPRNPAVCGMCP